MKHLIFTFLLLHRGVAGQEPYNFNSTLFGIIIGSVLGGLILIGALTTILVYVCCKRRATPKVTENVNSGNNESITDTSIQAEQSNTTSNSSLPFHSEPSISQLSHSNNQNSIPSVNKNNSPIQRNVLENVPHSAENISSTKIQSEPVRPNRVTPSDQFYHSSFVVPRQSSQFSHADFNGRAMFSNAGLRPQEARSRHSWAVNPDKPVFDEMPPFSREYLQHRLPRLDEGDTSFSPGQFHYTNPNERPRPVETVTQDEYMQQRYLQQRSRFSLVEPSPQKHPMKIALPGMTRPSQTNMPLRKAMTLETPGSSKQIEDDVRHPYPARRLTPSLANDNEVYRVEGPLVISNAFNFLNEFSPEKP